MWVDEVAWLSASTEYPGLRFVTVGMDDVSFKKSVREGSILHFRSERVRLGTTSVTYHVAVCSGELEIFSTHVTMVRVDEKGEKTPIKS